MYYRKVPISGGNSVVECLLAKEDVASSSLVSRSIKKSLIFRLFFILLLIRKGAISARKDEKVLIPLNMADGSLICIGKGNKDWNESAPHGAGR